MRSRIVIATLLALALAPLGRADGLPISDAGAPATVGGANGNVRYVAVPTERGTLVARLGEVVYASRLFDGRFTVPVVALDRTSSGLSTDRSTLVLITPRQTFPRARTTFLVLKAPTLRVRSQIVLKGDFSFDALSPDGTLMYVIHYLSPRDPTRYEVRAIAVATGKLMPSPIVDKSEPDERMAGLPITRVTTVDGRFAYTLYDGAGKEPFIHALDTMNGEAKCIDLAALSGRQNLYDLRLDLNLGDTRLAVFDGAEEVIAVDARTYEPLSAPVAAKEASSPPSRWPFVGLAALAVLLVVIGAAVLGLRRRLAHESRRSSPPSRVRT